METSTPLNNSTSEQLIVPLSSPKKTGKLEICLISSSITISSHNKQNVIINALSPYHNLYIPKKTETSKTYSNNIGLFAKEENNLVTISSNYFLKSLILNIKVPENFSLDLSTVNGEVLVNNLCGDFKIKNVNNNVVMSNICGSVNAETINGKLDIQIKELNVDSKISLKSLNKDICLKIPTKSKANLKAMSDNAEVFADFDLEIETKKPYSKHCDKQTNKTKTGNWIIGKINGGGTPLKMESLNGDVILEAR